MSDDQKKKADKMANETIVFSETSVYAFAPQLSYVPKDFAAGDPNFWNPKPEAPKPTPRKKPAQAATAPAANPQ